MTHFMYKSSVPVVSHNLKNLAAMLKMAERDAKARGIDPSVLLNARLAPDMFPLTKQVQIATDQAKGCGARLTGTELPSYADDEETFAELDARIRKTLAFLRTLKAAQFAGSETREIVMKLPRGSLTFSGQDYLNGWVFPNFYFHLCAAYNILRHNGVALGKLDFLGAVPGMTAGGQAAKMIGAKAARKPKRKSQKK